VRSRVQTDVPRDEIKEFCVRHHIRKLSFFGSVLREDFGAESDVDVLVEFEANQSVGLLRLAAMELELWEILGRKVHMRTPAELSRYFREEVCQSAEVQYAEG
jgi:predicted nucleotidyltransferase